MNKSEARRILEMLAFSHADMRGAASFEISKAVSTGASELCCAVDALGDAMLLDPPEGSADKTGNKQEKCK